MFRRFRLGGAAWFAYLIHHAVRLRLMQLGLHVLLFDGGNSVGYPMGGERLFVLLLRKFAFYRLRRPCGIYCFE